MSKDIHLNIQFDDLRAFHVAVFRVTMHRSFEWSFEELVGLNMTRGGRSSTKRYRTIKGALDDCMSALVAYHESTERP